MQVQQKRQRRRNIVVLIITLTISAALFVLLQAPSGGPGSLISSPLVGRPAPDFTISTWNNSPPQVVHLAALKGKPIVVNFWASWCDACRVEAPVLESAWQKYRSRGVVFVGVAFEDNERDGTSFLRQYHITYLSGPDTTGAISEAYMVTNVGVPQSLFIDREGTIVSKFVGAMDDGSLDRAIQPVLK